MGINRGLLHSSRGPLCGKVYTCLLPGCLVLSLYRSAAISEVAVGFMGDEASKDMFMLSSSAWSISRSNARYFETQELCVRSLSAIKVTVSLSSLRLLARFCSSLSKTYIRELFVAEPSQEPLNASIILW